MIVPRLKIMEMKRSEVINYSLDRVEKPPGLEINILV